MDRNKRNTINFFISLFVITLMVVPLIGFGQDATGSGAPADASGSGRPAPNTTRFTIKLANPFKTDSIQGLIKTLVDDILLPIGGVVAVLMIMWAGFLFVTARGNPTQIATAKKALLWAVLGAAILLGAWVISQAIEATINQLRA